VGFCLWGGTMGVKALKSKKKERKSDGGGPVEKGKDSEIPLNVKNFPEVSC